VSLEGAECRSSSSTVAGWRRRHTNCRPMARLPKIAPPDANRRQAATLRDGQRQKSAQRDRGRQETPTSVNGRRLRCCSGESHSCGSARRTLSARATFWGAKPITRSGRYELHKPTYAHIAPSAAAPGRGRQPIPRPTSTRALRARAARADDPGAGGGGKSDQGTIGCALRWTDNSQD